MRHRALSTIIAFVFASSLTIVHAQIGIYGKFNAVNVSSGASSNYVSPGWFKGVGGGVYYDFAHLGPVSLGADVRGDFLFQSPQRYKDVLFGVRLAAKAPVLPIRPYVQGSVGIGGSSHGGLGGNGLVYNNKFQYWIIGGVDYTIFPHVDWRVGELGYGHMTGISSGTPVSGINLFTIGTGVVLRLP
jgi:hypothetical protein